MASATYLYAVVKTAKPARLGRSPKGLAGAGAPRLVDAGDGYQIVVATAPLAAYSAAAIEAKLADLDWVAERGAAHEAVVEHAASLGTVVPMKLFTLFESDERAASHVKKMKRTLDRVVGRIEGCDEWGVRILLDETRAAKVASARAAKVVSGTSFLVKKKEQHEAKTKLASAARARVDDLYDQLEKTARRAVRRPAPNRDLAARVMLDAVFLVPRKGEAKFKKGIASAAKALVKDGFHVTLTGPWPAYSFIEGR